MRARSLVVLSEEVVDVRALDRQEHAAMDAHTVVVRRCEGGAGFITGHRFGELGGIHRTFQTVSPESQWGTAVGPGLSGVIFGTNATSLLMSPDFLGPTSACSRTSLSVSTGTISIFPW